ncbi:hypothetical protein OLZ33_21710 [Pantoea ananatis]|uniref:hypothetical protein n=1 Tax=Pantoea ananas TaxID=553 RepID=UPI0022222141|nr:hypothetical protein [Pantoea ananatis]MCW1834588.1 hypothetical protein [Pantoea ananatis]
MDNENYLQKVYTNRSQETIHEWLLELEKNFNEKDVVFYPEKLLALTSGIHPELNPQIRVLLSDLRSLTNDDQLAEVMSEENFHMTFLAVTQSIYESYEDITDIADLTERFSLIIRNSTLNVKELQLVALPNQLLLAGIPDRDSITLRQRFWEELISSDWQSKLHDRYPRKALPPDFWHTTLLRYKSKKLPPQIREYFLSNSEKRYGEIDGKIKLVLAPYNWNNPLNII